MEHSRKAAERRAQTMRVAERRAFEGYLRWGRAADPGANRRAAARGLSLKALGDVLPTNYYTWRTAHDERVRPTHAANEGRVFAWSDPPVAGHPGHEPNCRCTAEPYYGTPFVSDTTLPLKRETRTDGSGQEVWQSIETLTRPDGSLAASQILMRDGTAIRSTFNGGLVVNNVRLPDGRVVRVERQDGVQSVFVGDGTAPVVQSVWGAGGPRIAPVRQRAAQLSMDAAIVVPGRRPVTPGNAVLGLGDLVGRALRAIYDTLTAEPESLGAGSDDVAVLALRVWQDGSTEPLYLGALAAAAVAQSCKRLPEVQKWTTEAAVAAGPIANAKSPQAWGTAIHYMVKTKIYDLKEAFPAVYADIDAEVSFAPAGEVVKYATSGSTRLDVYEDLGGTICVYDIKTGNAQLTPARIKQIGDIVAKRGRGIVFIIEIRPFE